ncbi:ferredoxin [Yinghuangia sp. ASG 101]|uniref:ferredoxin n=1 Tax=Yinghuangia sp. ASG 101 TaxID=2896848 RepID=UPI001E627DA4|nr:ferredoxin [Yinghuangia sp. ASG 101]UGQ12481.1 ferredoxin [Yinghuangia sp. ASG 101]
MRVSVDHELCEYNALCVPLAPDVFALSDDDELTVLDEHPADSLRSQVEAAAATCPRQAIRVTDDTTPG